jgi:hypothetical protein
MRTAPRRDGESAVQRPLPSMAGLLNSPAHLAVYVPRRRAIDHASILMHGRGGGHPETDARLSHAGKGATVVYVYTVVVTVLNLVFWVGILFSLPGTWLMVLVSAVLKWWQPECVQVSWTVLSVAGGLAVLGEVLEFALGAGGHAGLGGGRRPVLGDPLQTCHRRHHGARPGAGRVLLPGMNRRLCICTPPSG